MTSASVCMRLRLTPPHSGTGVTKQEVDANGNVLVGFQANIVDFKTLLRHLYRHRTQATAAEQGQNGPEQK